MEVGPSHSGQWMEYCGLPTNSKPKKHRCVRATGYHCSSKICMHSCRVLTTLHHSACSSIAGDDSSSQCSRCTRCYLLCDCVATCPIWEQAAARRSTTLLYTSSSWGSQGLQISTQNRWFANTGAVATRLRQIELSANTQQCLRQGILFACALLDGQAKVYRYPLP